MLNTTASRAGLPRVARSHWLLLDERSLVRLSAAMGLTVDVLLEAVQARLSDDPKVTGLKCHDGTLAHPRPFKRVVWRLMQESAKGVLKVKTKMAGTGSYRPKVGNL